MDTVFGTDATAQKDQERMAEINHEIGLTALSGGHHRSSDDDLVVGDEKGAMHV
jgi:hypothetical protein